MTVSIMRGGKTWLIVIAVVVAVIGGLLLRLMGPGGDPGESAGEAPIASAIKVVTDGGETRLIVPPAALRASGIAVAPLRAATIEPGIAAFATALQPQALLEQRRAILAAAAESARARAAAVAADTQAGRLRSLNADNSIVSKRELEAGQVAAVGERAGVQVASSQLALLEATAARQWGPVIARWLVSGSPRLDRVFDGRALLLQIAPTREIGASTPAVAHLAPLQGGRLEALVISASPQADAQFQTRTFFTIAPANAQLLPGMTIPARFSTGQPVHGAEVPAAAIVRWNGGSFVYVSAGANRFVRRAVSTELASSDGWIDASLAPGTRVVVAGAQLLLSEELRGSGAGPAAER